MASISAKSIQWRSETAEAPSADRGLSVPALLDEIDTGCDLTQLRRCRTGQQCLQSLGVGVVVDNDVDVAVQEARLDWRYLEAWAATLDLTAALESLRS